VTTPVTIPRRRPLHAAAARVNGTALGIGAAVTANGACMIGLGGLAMPLYVGGAVGLAFLLARRRPIVAAELAAWLWILGPQVRRAIDLTTGYHEPSIVLAAAPLASLACLPHLRRLRTPAAKRRARPLLIAAAAICTAFAVGVVRVGPVPATVALLSWLVPVLFGLQIVAVTDDVDELRAMVERVIVWGVLIVGVYGVAQYFLAPAWDTYWMANSPMSSIGAPVARRIRVFSTLNSPGPLAVFLPAGLLWLTEARHRLQVPAQLAGYATLALSLVRSAWLAYVLGLLVVLAIGDRHARRNVLALVALVLVALLQFGGPVLTAVQDRVGETMEGTQDDSFAARLVLHREMIPVVADESTGYGLGSSGGESRWAETETAGIVSMDSGLLEFGLALGPALALVVLVSLAVASLGLVRGGVRGGQVSAGAAAALLSVLVQMAFANTLTDVGGVTFYLLWALAASQVAARPHPTP
jgi:hypothetical protein